MVRSDFRDWIKEMISKMQHGIFFNSICDVRKDKQSMCAAMAFSLNDV